MGHGFDRHVLPGIALLITLTAANVVLFGVAPAGLGLAAAAAVVWALRGVRYSHLSRQREWFRTTLASIGDAVITTDTAGRVTFLNPVAEALTGWPAAEAAARPLTEVFHIRNETTRKEVDNPALRALREGVTVGLANHTVLVARDGAERPIDDSAAPIKGEDGAVGGAVLVFRDITERKRAEVAQARLAAIVASSDDAILSKALDGTILSWNTGAERVFGWTAAEAVGRSITLIIPPERIDEERDILARLRRGERIDHFETVRVTKDGRRLDISLTISPVRDAEGEIVGASKVARDVTEKKRVERALRESEGRFRALVTATSDVVYRMSPDWSEMWHLDGRTFIPDTREPSRTWVDTYIPEVERERVAAAIAEAVRTRGMFALEHRILRADGTVGWTFSRAVPILDAAGQLVEWFGAASDVTRRKQAEEDLARVTAESERRRRLYEAALNNTPDLVYVFDLAHRFTYANEALLAMWGKTWDEGIGRTCLELGYEPWHAAMHDREIEQVRATRQPVRGEVPFTGTHGRRIYDYIFVPVLGTGGEVEAVAGTTRDVTDRRAMEEAVRAADERYRALVTAIDQGFCVVEVLFDGDRPTDYRFLDANRAFERQTGLAGPVGRTIRELVPGIEDRWVEIYARVAATGEPTRFTEGSEALGRWWDVFASRVGGPGSRAVAILFSDITARRAAEAERERLLKEVETERGRLDEAFRHAPAFMAVLRGPDHVFELANDRYLDLVGRRPVIGRPVREALPEVVAQGFIGLLDRVYRTGEPYVGTGTRVVLEHGGGRPPEERFLDFVYQPLRDAGGAVTGILVQGVDLTDRRRAEEALRESQDRLAEALRTARMCAWEWDPATDRVAASETAADVYGLRPDQDLGSSAIGLGLVHPEDVAQHRDMVRSAAERGESWHVEFRIVRPRDGTVAWLEERATARRDPASGAVRLTGLVWDVTDRKRAELELRDADRKKDDFIALLAHELRNPLAPIRNGLEVMRLAPGDPDAVARARQMMDRQLGHMVRMVDDLLDVSRIGRNKMELRRARVTLAEVVTSAVETARPAIDAAGHELTVSLPAAPVHLDADLTRLAQVFSNLLTNSAKYTPRGGRVWLSAERTDGHVVVSLRDTGIGIPAAALPTIFDMFSQVDRPIERSTGGLGIGLAIVKGLVEMHGGTVTAASDGAGRGSTFTVTLPALPAAAAAPAATASPEAGPGRPGRRVLVVDDNRDGAESLADMLRLLGDDVRTAHDGLQAVEEAGRFRPEVILMDVGMPRLNGLDATRKIREQPWGRDVTIIALTGWGQEDDRERSREAGCDGHLVKPVDPADLARVLGGGQ